MKKQKEEREFDKNILTNIIQNLPDKLIYSSFIPAEASNADRQLFMEYFAKDYVKENADTNNVIIVLKVPQSYIKKHKDHFNDPEYPELIECCKRRRNII